MFTKDSLKIVLFSGKDTPSLRPTLLLEEPTPGMHENSWYTRSLEVVSIVAWQALNVGKERISFFPLIEYKGDYQ